MYVGGVYVCMVRKRRECVCVCERVGKEYVQKEFNFEM